MSLKKLSLLVFYLLLSSVYAQETPTINKYFIILSPSPNTPNTYGKIIKDGSRILVKDSFGNKKKGYIAILSDSTFVLENLHRDKKDTFNVNEVIQVSTASLTRSVFGVMYVTTGILSIGIAAIFIELSDVHDIMGILGSVFLLGGIATPIGFAVLKSKRFKKKHGFQFKIYHAKGFKLKRKHLPHLFPLNK
jgi:hypothetical protein